MYPPKIGTFFNFISDLSIKSCGIYPQRGDLNSLHSVQKKDSIFCLYNQWNRKHRNAMVGHVFRGPSKLGMKDLLPARVTILLLLLSPVSVAGTWLLILLLWFVGLLLL